jgi:hypothetical protein
MRGTLAQNVRIREDARKVLGFCFGVTIASATELPAFDTILVLFRYYL